MPPANAVAAKRRRLPLAAARLAGASGYAVGFALDCHVQEVASTATPCLEICGIGGTPEEQSLKLFWPPGLSSNATVVKPFAESPAMWGGLPSYSPFAFTMRVVDAEALVALIKFCKENYCLRGATYAIGNSELISIVPFLQQDRDRVSRAAHAVSGAVPCGDFVFRFRFSPTKAAMSTDEARIRAPYLIWPEAPWITGKDPTLVLLYRWAATYRAIKAIKNAAVLYERDKPGPKVHVVPALGLNDYGDYFPLARVALDRLAQLPFDARRESFKTSIELAQSLIKPGTNVKYWEEIATDRIKRNALVNVTRACISAVRKLSPPPPDPWDSTTLNPWNFKNGLNKVP